MTRARLGSAAVEVEEAAGHTYVWAKRKAGAEERRVRRR